MDVSLKFYLNLEVEAAIQRSKEIIDEVKKVNGTMITLWHNQNLTDDQEWEGWKQVYEAILNYAS